MLPWPHGVLTSREGRGSGFNVCWNTVVRLVDLYVTFYIAIPRSSCDTLIVFHVGLHTFIYNSMNA